MQLMTDALAVPGSRHGMVFNPVTKNCGIIRFDPFDALVRCDVVVGFRAGGREYRLPLCADGDGFRFVDQTTTPCTVSFLGMEPGSALRCRLTAAVPFRPRDAAFSTVPVLAFRVEVSRIRGAFRWTPPGQRFDEVELFFEVRGAGLDIAAGDTGVDLRFTSRCPVRTRTERNAGTDEFSQHDRLVAPGAEMTGTRFVKTVRVDDDDACLDVAWCTWSPPVLSVQGTRYPFRYTRRFASLEDVAVYASGALGGIFANARRVDGIVGSHNCGPATDHLLAYTLHSWLVNTWWADRDGRDWFSVWEGSCYFHSTVDVEFTQSPFYLAVWPELLGYELDAWPEYVRPGTDLLGDAGAYTLFLHHDAGVLGRADGQVYNHEMEVEETANYLILLYCHYARTGDASVIGRHRDTARRFAAFLAAADTTGNGVPDRGVANTIDDASPAVQFGREQTYLAVKTLTAFACAARLPGMDDADRDAWAGRAALLRTAVEEKGWTGDHYAVLLDPDTAGIINPWTKKELETPTVPGWDAAHIYTLNGPAVADMAGLGTGLNPARLAADLRTAARRCLDTYGCTHSDFMNSDAAYDESMEGLAGNSANPGWISMNMLRDLAAFYRGVDLRRLAGRYWEWQAVTNANGDEMLFFETFNGNNLCWYPRGIAVWGWFDALAGLVIDVPAGVDRCDGRIPNVRVPRLWDADWIAGACTEMGADG